MREKKQKPRILIIKPILPYPPDQGTKVVSFGLIQALKENYDVCVLARLTDRSQEEYARELERWCSKVITVLAPNKKSSLHRFAYKILFRVKSLVLRRSLKSLYDCPGNFVKAARELSKEKFDLVIIEYWQLYKITALFPADKVALLTHDIDILVNRDISLLERNLFRKIGAVRRWLLERKEEMRAYRNVSRILTLTARDMAMAGRIAGEQCRIDVLPFGVDVDFLAPCGGKRNAREILFLGALEAVFNRDALAYFVKKIYPHMDELDEFSVTIVGGELPTDLAYFSSESAVEIVGKTGDVRPFLHRAACMILPLRFGGGMRIRILEAMAAGLPVVCTSVAMAGMPFEAGRDYLLADEPEEFVRQLQMLFASPEMGLEMAVKARAKIVENYSKSAQAEGTSALIARIIDSS